jgi:hypothetical protein
VSMIREGIVMTMFQLDHQKIGDKKHRIIREHNQRRDIHGYVPICESLNIALMQE